MIFECPIFFTQDPENVPNSFHSRLKSAIETEDARRKRLFRKGLLSEKKLREFRNTVSMKAAKGFSRIELEVDHRDGFGILN